MPQKHLYSSHPTFFMQNVSNNVSTSKEHFKTLQRVPLQYDMAICRDK